MVGKLRTNLSLIGPTMNTAAAVNRSLPVGYVGMSAETLKLLPTAVRNVSRCGQSTISWQRRNTIAMAAAARHHDSALSDGVYLSWTE